MKRQMILITFIIVLTALLSACGGSMQASKARSRGLIDRGYIVPAEEVHVADYLNYYDQRFPEPTDGQPLALDVRLGNPQVPPSGGDVWVQIGLQAARPLRDERAPLNLTLVLDESGSMNDAEKIGYLKQSLAVFLHSLRSDDIVSIVAYSNDARLLQPARAVGDGVWIRAAIQQLQPGGSTNLHAGLMLGFEEAWKHFDSRRNNRVVLLTDGIANLGVTDPDRIAEDVRWYNDQGIYLSTIGLGVDLDDNLLHTLAKQGHGAYHFIDSGREMEKVFQEEADGLVQKTARDITVTLASGAGELVYVVGAGAQPPASGAQVQLDDMGAGDSQVLLARFQAEALRGPTLLARVTLTYTDVAAQRQRSETREITVAPGEPGADPLADIEVRRNVTIVRTAQALQQIDVLFNRGRYGQALALARQMEAELREMAVLTGDAQMVEDADLFRRYQMTLSAALGDDPSSSTEPQAPRQPQRWGGPAASPTPALPLITVD